MKNIKKILSEIFHFMVVKFSVYLNRHVFVILKPDLYDFYGKVIFFNFVK